MLDLPLCRHRGDETIPGHHKCNSSKFVFGADGVEDTFCLRCQFADLPPDKPVARPATCSHLRKHARDADGSLKTAVCGVCPGGPLDVFECDHPGTPGEVTLLDCQSCAYKPGSKTVIDLVYVINLKKRPERLASFRSMQDRSGWRLPEPIIFEAFDGDLLGVPNHFRQGGGAWGCLRSHCAILERCIQSKVSSVLVMEDDAEWFPDAWAQLDHFLEVVPSDWSQLMLGGQHLSTPAKIAAGIVRCQNTQRTHAYVIRGAAMRSLLRAWQGATVHIDWVMGGDWQRGWPVYAPEPFLFGQAGGKSDISGRLNNSLYWNSPMNETVIALDAPPVIAAALRSRGLHMGFKRDADGVDVGLLKIVGDGSRTEDLQAFITTLTWEVASMRGRVATLWCPGLDGELVRRAHSGPVRVVKGTTVEAVLRQCRSLGLRRNYCTSHVLLLRASRQTVEGLPGFHRGYWLDHETGQDRGQQQAVAGDVHTGLRQWGRHTFEEAERMQAVPLVWHDKISVYDVENAFPDRVCLEIFAESPEDVAAAFAMCVKPQRVKRALPLTSAAESSPNGVA